MRGVYGEQTCTEILPVRGYRDGREGRFESFSGPVLFRFVVPPLQSEVVGPYPVWCAWFPSHLPLERTGCIQIFGS
jgi:hypothetical protein